MIVFNAVEEFLKELAMDMERVERKIIRLTNVYQQSQMTPVIRHLFVVATYKAVGEIVQCKQYIGDLWNVEQDKKTIEQSIALHQQHEEECQRLGLEVRAGMYTEVSHGN